MQLPLVKMEPDSQEKAKIEKNKTKKNAVNTRNMKLLRSTCAYKECGNNPHTHIHWKSVFDNDANEKRSCKLSKWTKGESARRKNVLYHHQESPICWRKNLRNGGEWKAWWRKVRKKNHSSFTLCLAKCPHTWAACIASFSLSHTHIRPFYSSRKKRLNGKDKSKTRCTKERRRNEMRMHIEMWNKMQDKKVQQQQQRPSVRPRKQKRLL